MVKLTYERIDNDCHYGKCYTDVDDGICFDSLIEAIQHTWKKRGLVYEIDQWVERETDSLLKDGGEQEAVLGACDAPDECACNAGNAADCTCFVKDKNGKAMRLGDAEVHDLPDDLQNVVYGAAHESASFWINETLNGNDDGGDDKFYESVTGISADCEWKHIAYCMESLAIVNDGGKDGVTTLKIHICNNSIICLSDGFAVDGGDTLEINGVIPLVTAYGPIVDTLGEGCGYDIDNLSLWAVSGMPVLGIDYNGDLVLQHGDGDDCYDEIARLDYYKWSAGGFKGQNNPNVDFLVNVASVFGAAGCGVVTPDAILESIMSLFGDLNIVDDETRRRVKNGATSLYCDLKVAAKNLISVWSAPFQYSSECVQFYMMRFIEAGKSLPDFPGVFAYVLDLIVQNGCLGTKPALEWILGFDKMLSRRLLSDEIHQYNHEMTGKSLHPTTVAMLRAYAIKGCKDIALTRAVVGSIIEGIAVQSYVADCDDEKILLSNGLMDKTRWSAVFNKMKKKQLVSCLMMLSLINKQVRTCNVTASNYVFLLRHCAVAMVNMGLHKDLNAFRESWVMFLGSLKENQQVHSIISGQVSSDMAVIQSCLAVSSAIDGGTDLMYGLINSGQLLSQITSVYMVGNDVECSMVRVLDEVQCARLLALMAYGALDLSVRQVLDCLSEKQLTQACADNIPENCLMPLVRKIKNASKYSSSVKDMKGMLGKRLIRVTELTLPTI